MVRVRDKAEAIAFYRGEKRDHRDLISKFADIFENTTRLIGWNRNLAFFTTRYPKKENGYGCSASYWQNEGGALG